MVYASFEETEKGTICEGKLADLAVLSHNPYEADSETLKNIKVEITILGGKIVYQREKAFLPANYSRRIDPVKAFRLNESCSGETL